MNRGERDRLKGGWTSEERAHAYMGGFIIAIWALKVSSGECLYMAELKRVMALSKK